MPSVARQSGLRMHGGVVGGAPLRLFAYWITSLSRPQLGSCLALASVNVHWTFTRTPARPVAIFGTVKALTEKV